jgi:hypothetical protein
MYYVGLLPYGIRERTDIQKKPRIAEIELGAIKAVQLVSSTARL